MSLAPFLISGSLRDSDHILDLQIWYVYEVAQNPSPLKFLVAQYCLRTYSDWLVI